jgi:hypothetical protein
MIFLTAMNLAVLPKNVVARKPERTQPRNLASLKAINRENPFSRKPEIKEPRKRVSRKTRETETAIHEGRTAGQPGFPYPSAVWPTLSMRSGVKSTISN